MTETGDMPPVRVENLTVDSPREYKLAWFKEYFRPHFDQWVTGTIGKYISVSEALVAFILISCAIDWLAGFYWGKSTRYETRNAYVGFVRKYFPAEYDAEALYDSLRNGLVHMFTIKGKKYQLVHNNSWLHLKKDEKSGSILLNSENLFADWLRAKDKYFDAVEDDQRLLDNLLERYIRDGMLGLGSVEVR